MDAGSDVSLGALVTVITLLSVLSGVIGWLWSIRTLAISTRDDLSQLKTERARAIAAADLRLEHVIAAADLRLEKAINAVMESFRSDVERVGEKAASELRHFVEIQKGANDQMARHLDECKVDHNLLLAAMERISSKAAVK